MRILVVDTDKYYLDLYLRVLSGAGHQVLSARDHKEALSLFDNNAFEGACFDLIITDIQIPQLDGEELAREIKTRNTDCLVMLIAEWPPEKGHSFDRMFTKGMPDETLLECVNLVFNSILIID